MKRFPIICLLLLNLCSFATADVIIFKDGREIETERAWEEEGQIKCLRYGGVIGYPKEQIDRIVEGKIEEAETSSVSEGRNVDGVEANGTPLQKMKNKFLELYLELMNFKDDKNFHRFGFSPRNKYGNWKQKVEFLREDPNAKLFITESANVGDLLMLGFEYLSSHGRETEYSRFINQELRKTLNL